LHLWIDSSHDTNAAFEILDAQIMIQDQTRIAPKVAFAKVGRRDNVAAKAPCSTPFASPGTLRKTLSTVVAQA